MLSPIGPSHGGCACVSVITGPVAPVPPVAPIKPVAPGITKQVSEFYHHRQIQVFGFITTAKTMGEDKIHNPVARNPLNGLRRKLEYHHSLHGSAELL